MKIFMRADAKIIFASALLILLGAAAPRLAAASTTPFVDGFSGDALNACVSDGASFGPWTSVYAGYGCNQVETAGGQSFLDEKPMVSTAASITHAAMVVGPSFGVPLTLSEDVLTSSQLRINSPPNPWEVAWVLWDYTDDNHFYYFLPKPNGWELGKEDPSYPGSQRFLATGASPVFPIGAWYAVRIVQNQNTMTVYVNGQLITAFTDNETPYTSGSIGLYCEDSEARFENVAVNTALGAGASSPSVDAKAPQRFLSPAQADGINDVAAFGPDAAEVSIYNLKGRLVYHASAQSGAPLIWNCRDGAGRIEESGVYIAKIRTTGSGVLYQSFAIVK